MHSGRGRAELALRERDRLVLTNYRFNSFRVYGLKQLTECFMLYVLFFLQFTAIVTSHRSNGRTQ